MQRKHKEFFSQKVVTSIILLLSTVIYIVSLFFPGEPEVIILLQGLLATAIVTCVIWFVGQLAARAFAGRLKIDDIRKTAAPWLLWLPAGIFGAVLVSALVWFGARHVGLTYWEERANPLKTLCEQRGYYASTANQDNQDNPDDPEQFLDRNDPKGARASDIRKQLLGPLNDGSKSDGGKPSAGAVVEIVRILKHERNVTEAGLKGAPDSADAILGSSLANFRGSQEGSDDETNLKQEVHLALLDHLSGWKGASLLSTGQPDSADAVFTRLRITAAVDTNNGVDKKDGGAEKNSIERLLVIKGYYELARKRVSEIVRARNRYFGMIQWLTFAAYFGGFFLLSMAYARLRRQEKLSEVELALPINQRWDAFEEANPNVAEELLRLAGRCSEQTVMGLVQRDALEELALQKSVGGGKVQMVRAVRDQSEKSRKVLVDTLAREGFHSFNLLMWIVPVLGFLGTVWGFGTAMTGTVDVFRTSDQVARTGAVTAVVGLLAVAFDTTLVALVLGIPSMFTSQWLKRQQREYLENTANDTGSRLCRTLFPGLVLGKNQVDTNEEQAAPPSLAEAPVASSQIAGEGSHE
jgi:biopolymer transport protein ExbB/TolQ